MLFQCLKCAFQIKPKILNWLTRFYMIYLLPTSPPSKTATFLRIRLISTWTYTSNNSGFNMTEFISLVNRQPRECVAALQAVLQALSLKKLDLNDLPPS